jgi:two-component system sensor histidine kinase DctS
VLHALQKQGEQAAEAGRIVQRIREFLTRRAPQRERSDLLGIAKRAVELLQRDLERGQVQVLWPEAAAVSAVYADPILMEQVLINLIRNAADALRGQSRDKRIGIGLSNAGPQFVRIDIDDNGPGLDGRTIEQLTAPFYSTKSDGMGMGLAICRSIVEIHHGGMAAGVSPWGGARFSFTLPVYDPAASETAEELTL